jgi:tripartite-type tricarboxylate transporter receptor subunit TctC
LASVLADSRMSKREKHVMRVFRAEVGIVMLLMLASLGQPAWAQKNYPTQKITFQVAFAAGGIADVVARLIAQKLGQRVGHEVLVENRGGASGNLAAKAVSIAAPDGYTILAATASLAVKLPLPHGLGQLPGENWVVLDVAARHRMVVRTESLRIPNWHDTGSTSHDQGAKSR